MPDVPTPNVALTGGAKAAQIWVSSGRGYAIICAGDPFLTFFAVLVRLQRPRKMTAEKTDGTMRQIVAIDPGTNESGFCALRDGQPVLHGTVNNRDLLNQLRSVRPSDGTETTVAIEQMQNYGGPVSTDVFQTLLWSGRFQEAAESNGFSVVYLSRVRVKTHLCNKPNATDAEVWAAVCGRYGVPYSRGKQAPLGSVLHGITGDARQALAVGLLLHDQQQSLASGRFFTVGTEAAVVSPATKAALGTR